MTQNKDNKPKAKNKWELVISYINEKWDLRNNVISDLIEWREKGNSEYLQCNINDLYCSLQMDGYRFSLNDIKAIVKSSLVTTYNPFNEYFDNLLPWKPGDPDYIGQIQNYVVTKDRSRFEVQLYKMLIRSIACSLCDDVFNKHIFVLISQQNDGKSTFLRWLCPEKLKDYYTENINFADKDSHIAQTENFIINIDELATINRADVNKLKAFISKVDDKSRRAYDAREVRRIRRANYLGSTNNHEFLTDPTGNVRWICFEVDKIDFNYKKAIDIDKVWAQAYYLFKTGSNYQLTREELVENEKNNGLYMSQTTEMDIIQDWFVPGTKEDSDMFCTPSNLQIIIKATLNVPVKSENIGRALTYFGFKREQRFFKENGYQRKGYYLKFKSDRVNQEMLIQATFMNLVPTDF